jgi:hypothetical protein
LIDSEEREDFTQPAGSPGPSKTLQSIKSAGREFLVGTVTASEIATSFGFLMSRLTGESVTTGKSF